MAEIVTLNLDELGGAPSAALLADIEAAGLSCQLGATDDSVGGGLQRRDFRLHADGTFDGVDFDGRGALLAPQRLDMNHWLLGSVYGREVLKTYHRLFHPEMKISKWRVQPELNDDLERVIDQLGLRDLREPKTVSEKLRYLSLMSKLTLKAETAVLVPA